MTKNVVVKGCVAILASIVFLAGFGVLLGKVDLWGTGPDGSTIVFSFLISLAGCLLLGWVNCRLLLRALLGALAAMGVGLPLAYLALSPLTDVILTTLLPNTGLARSSSLAAVWFLLAPVALVEWITDHLGRSKRWANLVLGVVVSLIVVLIVEILTSGFGQTSKLGAIRLVFFAPTVWGIAVVSVNYEKRGKNEEG